MTLKSSLYLLSKFSVINHITNKGISTMVNGTLLNFGKRYKDDLRVIFDQRPKLYLGLDALSNQKILKGVYCRYVLARSYCSSIYCAKDGHVIISL